LAQEGRVLTCGGVPHPAPKILHPLSLATMALAVPDAYVNGCNFLFDAKGAEANGSFKKDDPLQEHYKKGGLWGSITGAFGDKKTLYCHHMTQGGEPAARAAAKAGKTFKSADEVWAFIGRPACCGRFAFDTSSGSLKCGAVVKADHDNTCNPDTCPFIGSGLPCPTPAWAHK